MIAKVGLLAAGVIAALTLAAVLAGRWRWQSETRTLRDRLEAARVAVGSRNFQSTHLHSLPAPVQRYLRAALGEGRPLVAAATLEHAGTFNTSEGGDRWRPFVSTQRVVIDRPGFVWAARIAMAPALPAFVHDAYVAGEGLLRAQVLGLFTVAEERATPAVARGELMRFLAEAVWYPTALLPGPNLQWEPLDERSARATLSDGEVSVSLQFEFGVDGWVEAVGTQARERSVAGSAVSTPWRARLWNYAERGGMRVPLDGEVMWVLPQGPAPYWRGHITGVAYEFGR